MIENIEPRIGMTVSSHISGGGASIFGKDGCMRRGRIVAIYPRHKYYMVRFAAGYVECFKYIPKKYLQAQKIYNEEVPDLLEGEYVRTHKKKRKVS